MSIDKLKRIMWRLREKHEGVTRYTLRDVEEAIMMEVGLDKRTTTKYIALLITMHKLKRSRWWHFHDIAGVI